LRRKVAIARSAVSQRHNCGVCREGEPLNPKAFSKALRLLAHGVVDGLRFLPFALLGCTAAFSQSVSLGVKGGARLTGDLLSSGERISESKRYTLGPTVEFRLPFRLGLEIDGLYKRVGTREFNTDILGDQFRSRDRSNSWEFPILVKYRIILGKIARPYVSGGYAIRAISGSGTAENICCFSPSPSVPSTVARTVTTYSTNYDVSHGVVVGGGVELKAGPLSVSPEVRYTRWNNSALSTSGSHGFFAESPQNQAEVLLGISWH
jgi:hypothetical protein